MKIKIKSIPEDFIVEERALLPFTKKGPFGAYLLKKRGWNTVGLLLKLSKELNIPFKHFSYGGKKDRHALATQYITIKGSKISEIKEADYSLEFCGFTDRPMGPDLIDVNRFEVAVRNLKKQDVELAIGEIEPILSRGYPNYFDDQRFGSVDVEQGYFAEKVLKRHFNGALKIYLTSINDGDSKKERERKSFFVKNWGNWNLCRDKAETEFERKTFDYLVKKPKDFLGLLKTIPRERLSIYFSAYQGNIWNEVLRRIIKEEAILPLMVYPGVAGDYFFYSKVNDNFRVGPQSLKIPTLAGNIKFSNDATDRFYKQVMEENGIRKAMFNSLKLRQSYFKSTLRSAIARPQSLSFKVFPDEFNKDRKKLVLKFSLLPGSYATMLLKRLFCAIAA